MVEELRIEAEAHGALHERAEQEISRTYPVWLRSKVVGNVIGGSALIVLLVGVVFVFPLAILPTVPANVALMLYMVRSGLREGRIPMRRMWGPVLAGTTFTPLPWG